MPRQTFGELSLDIPEDFVDSTTVTLVRSGEERFEGLLALNNVHNGDSMITIGQRAQLNPRVPLIFYAEHQIAILNSSQQDFQIITQGELNLESGQDAYQLEVAIKHDIAQVTQRYIFLDNSTRILVLCGSCSGSQSAQLETREYLAILVKSLTI